MKISAFCATTNALKFNYPVIESIRSFLAIVDELVVIDGGSTDGTLEAIRSIGDPKVRIICDEDTKWEEDWTYSRMSHNFNRGYEECTGDVVFKFDIDWIYKADPQKKFKDYCELMQSRGKLALQANKIHYVILDRHFTKKDSPFLVFKRNCESRGFKIKWGLDMEQWGWGNIPIIHKFTENGTNFGHKIANVDMDAIVGEIHAYDFSFMNEEQLKELRYRNYYALTKQAHLEYGKVTVRKPIATPERVRGDREYVYDLWKGETRANFERRQSIVPLDYHSVHIREKVRTIKPDMFGYNAFGIINEKCSYGYL